ncbi:hypothetical protein LXL04_025241 [Taraxacum kok-saghyz]
MVESGFSEVIELKSIPSIEIEGSLNTHDLSPNTRYGAYLINLRSIPRSLPISATDFLRVFLSQFRNLVDLHRLHQVFLSQFRNPVDLHRLLQFFLSEFRNPVDLHRLYQHVNEISFNPLIWKDVHTQVNTEAYTTTEWR